MTVPATSLLPGERPAVVLHVGMGKTGSTSIQGLLHRNRKRLADRGVLYPATPGKRRHVRLGLAMQPADQGPGGSFDWRRQPVSTPAELRPLLERELVAELRAGGLPRALMSDEGLFASHDQVLHNMRDLLSRIANSVRVVVYLRRQDDHAASRYQQAVKLGGEVRRLGEWLGPADFSRKYDYHAQLECWRTMVEPDELVVRVFEPGRFRGGSLAADFLTAAGLNIQPDDLEKATNRNESLDADSVEFLRLLNLYRQEQPGEIPGMLTLPRLAGRLMRASSGPTLTLPSHRLDTFMERWEASNRAVARDFLPDGPASLFVKARKSQGTTTEQCLDAARLDHLLDVAEIPTELHEPLRRIAEREAARPADEA